MLSEAGRGLSRTWALYGLRATSGPLVTPDWPTWGKLKWKIDSMRFSHFSIQTLLHKLHQGMNYCFFCNFVGNFFDGDCCFSKFILVLACNDWSFTVNALKWMFVRDVSLLDLKNVSSHKRKTLMQNVEFLTRHRLRNIYLMKAEATSC